MLRLYAVRGATTLDEDSRDEIVAKTQDLLHELMEVNGLVPADLVSVVFTSTEDLRSEFPAAAARLMGLDVPLLCARELDVHSSLALPRCIRVLVHCYSQAPPRPVYKGEAAQLLDPPEPA